MPSVRPRSSASETPSTAWTTPSRVRNADPQIADLEQGRHSVAHARVEERVQDVDDQVRDDDEDRAEEHRALDRRQVGVDDRVVGVAPDAGDVEDRLREDGAAEQDPEVEPGERDDRRQRRPQAVPEDRPAARERPFARAVRM